MPLNAVQYAAKCSAFWCKTQGVLVLNALRFAPKCVTIKHKYPPQRYK